MQYLQYCRLRKRVGLCALVSPELLGWDKSLLFFFDAQRLTVACLFVGLSSVSHQNLPREGQRRFPWSATLGCFVFSALVLNGLEILVLECLVACSQMMHSK